MGELAEGDELKDLHSTVIMCPVAYCGWFYRHRDEGVRIAREKEHYKGYHA